MLKAKKKYYLINTIIISITTIFAIMTINWHYEFFLLHKKERLINAEIEIAKSLNKQLITDYAEILSGANIIHKAKNILMMQEPKQKIYISL